MEFYFSKGTTGSGKTSTLYTMLSELNDHQRNILRLKIQLNIK